MQAVFKRLLSRRSNFRVEGNRKGSNTEVFGALLELKNPRSRLSRSQEKAKIFSALGELMWYLSADNSIRFIEHYIPIYGKFSNDGETANGAYGPRVFGKNPESEWQRAMGLLKVKPSTRNAVIQIYSNTDANPKNKDIPCTCTLHFVVRDEKLELHTHMRSNDAFMGLPHDIFSFTMMQEIAARELGVELGSYHHSVASLHLYDDEPAEDGKKRNTPKTNAARFVNEDYFDDVPMPAMPFGDPWPHIRKVLDAEAQFRQGNLKYEIEQDLPDYWQDLVRLLKIHALFKRETERVRTVEGYRRRNDPIKSLVREMSSEVYRLYVLDRLARIPAQSQDQLALNL